MPKVIPKLPLVRRGHVCSCGKTDDTRRKRWAPLTPEQADKLRRDCDKAGLGDLYRAADQCAITYGYANTEMALSQLYKLLRAAKRAHKKDTACG